MPKPFPKHKYIVPAALLVLTELIPLLIPFCFRLIDKLLPGKINWNDKTFQVPKIEAMKVMRERERIAMFTKCSQEFGVPEVYSFPTESLTDKVALNLAQVCVCIRAVGIEVRAIWTLL